MVTLWIIVGIVVLVAIILFTYFNRFVKLSQQIDNSISQIDVQLKKRIDLIPSLLESVKGYMKHERKIFTQISKARTEMVNAKAPEKKMKAAGKLQDALKSIFAVAEAYPDLKANQNFLHLQQEMSAIEDKIAYARQYYNDAIMTYNVMTETVPGRWFANMYGFKKKVYIKIPEEEKAVPKISFDDVNKD